MATAAIVLSSVCAGWARTAGFEVGVEGDSTVLRPEDRARGSYAIRSRGGGRVELFETDQDGIETSTLFAASLDVLEHYLVAALGDDLRDELGLDFLELPWAELDLAETFTLNGMQNGYRTLRRLDGKPVAAARDEVLSLVTLVPLSHLLGHDLLTLKRAFLDPAGSPVLVNGRYRPVQ